MPSNQSRTVKHRMGYVYEYLSNTFRALDSAKHEVHGPCEDDLIDAIEGLTEAVRELAKCVEGASHD